MRSNGFLICFMASAVLPGCSRFIPLPPEPSPGHLGGTAAQSAATDIPAVVEKTPFLPPPRPQEEAEKYTVVVNEVPIKELLFALARDARINVDVSPRVEGTVTINAVQQTLPQILERISRQANIRYEMHDRAVSVMPDDPYLRTYKVNYLNMQRDMKDNISVATQISSTGSTTSVGGSGGGSGGGANGGAGLNNSTTTVSSVSNQHFWSTITQNLRGILGKTGAGAMGLSGDLNTSSDDLIVSPETGVISVRATAKQHAEIQAFLDQILASANRQVLIEATVVEVDLNNDFQAGIDWNFLREAGNGFRGAVDLFVGPSGVPVNGVLNYLHAGADGKGPNGVSTTLRLLNKFGDTKVLSSPRLMVLNNQT